ncbi:MAG: glycosyltransferase family 4 protein [Bacteroidales bacterium]
MKLHIVSESEFLIQGDGVHTAFVDHVELMKAKEHLDVVVNHRGNGDVFHSHTYGPYYFWKGLPYKGRRVLTVHVIPDSIKGSLPMWRLFMPFAKWYFKQVYSFADVCIAISPGVADAIKATGAKTEIVNIHNPIPTNKWRNSVEKRNLGRELLGIDNDKFVVLGVGQLQGRKGVDDFVAVAKSLPQVQFVWAGGRPFKAMTEGVARIDKLIEMSPSNVKFAGMFDLDAMPLIYAAADMLLFPSFQENCPLAPIEAAACGLPVVFRDLKEYRLLYEHPYLRGVTVYDFVNITRRMMNDRKYYDNAAILSDNLVKQFDENRVREKLVDLYTTLQHNQLSKSISLSI